MNDIRLVLLIRKQRLLKSLNKSLQILEFLSGKKKYYGITEISSALNLYKSNVHEILSTFEAFGYVKKDPATRQYCLSLKFLHMAHLIGERFSFQHQLHEKLHDLCEKLGEAIFFAVYEDNQALILDGVFPYNSRILNQSIVGQSYPLHCTAAGKVFFANLPCEQIEELLLKQRESFTEYTITDKQNLFNELAEIRQRGYSVESMEYAYGVKSLAVPVFNAKQKIVGALAITGPSLRFPRQVYGRYVKELKILANDIGPAIIL